MPESNSSRIRVLALAAVFAAGLAACGGGGGGGESAQAVGNNNPPPAPTPDPTPDPDPVVLNELDVSKLSFCFDDGLGTDVITDNAGAELGYLCVVRPSDIDPAQLDADPNSSGNGYGYHVVAFPKSINDQTRGALLISGSYGSPYNPTDSVHLDIPAGTIRYSQTLVDGITSNFIVIQPAYINPSAVNADECSESAPVQGLNPNCHDLLRTWVLTGTQTCLVDAANCEEIPAFSLGSDAADQANSLFNRLETLADYLSTRVDSVPQALLDMDYPNLNLVGHSQGSGHVYLIAKHFSDVARACYLAGPRDFDRINDRYATWFTPISAGSIADISVMRALVSNRDADRAISLAWDHLGLVEGVHYQILDDPPGTEGHQAVFDSPDHTAVRQSFCF